MRNRPLAAYIAVLTILSAVFFAGMKLIGERGFYLAQFYMLGPAIAAVVTRIWFYENRFRDAKLRLGSFRHWLLAYGISFGVTVLSFVLFTALGAVRWDLTGNTFLNALSKQMAASGQDINDLPGGLTPAIMLILFVAGGLTIFNFVPGLITGFGEEFGWRGLMFPRLLRHGLWRALAAGSAVWFLWHLPVGLLFPDQRQFTFVEHAVNILVLLCGALFTFTYLAYIYFKSDSIIVASFAHIVMNNAARAGSYFVEVRDQTMANVGLTLAFGVLVAVLHYTGQLRIFDRPVQSAMAASTAD